MSAVESVFEQDDIASMLEEMESDSQNHFVKKFWNPPEGTSKIRFLPKSKKFNESVFYKKHRVHWVNKIPVECLNQTIVDSNGNLHEAEECPICKYVKKLYAVAGDDKESEEKRIAGSLSAKDRYIFRVIIRGKRDKDGNDMEAYPEFYEAGKTIFENLFYLLKEGEYGNFLSIAEGRDYNLVKRGTGRNTKYDGSMPAANSTPVFTDKEKLQILIKNIEDMNYNKLIEMKTVKEVEAILNDFINPTSETTSETVVIGAKPNTALVSTPSKASSDIGSDIDDLLDEF